MLFRFILDNSRVIYYLLIFFYFYIDNLLRKLKSNDYGCKLFGCFCGAIFYAEDFV